MFGARRKSSANLTKNQPFSLVFHHFLLSPSQRLRPLLPPPSLPLQPSSQPNTQQPHVVVAPPSPFSLSSLRKSLSSLP